MDAAGDIGEEGSEYSRRGVELDDSPRSNAEIAASNEPVSRGPDKSGVVPGVLPKLFRSEAIDVLVAVVAVVPREIKLSRLPALFPLFTLAVSPFFLTPACTGIGVPGTVLPFLDTVPVSFRTSCSSSCSFSRSVA